MFGVLVLFGAIRCYKSILSGILYGISQAFPGVFIHLLLAGGLRSLAETAVSWFMQSLASWEGGFCFSAQAPSIDNERIGSYFLCSP